VDCADPITEKSWIAAAKTTNFQTTALENIEMTPLLKNLFAHHARRANAHGDNWNSERSNAGFGDMAF
jgi:hypothetical protein